MRKHALGQLALVGTALIVFLIVLGPILTTPSAQEKGSGVAGIRSTPTVSIDNAYIEALSSAGGRFVIGTTGGAPDTSEDDNKRLLYGYPSNVGSSFSTLRINDGAATNDYLLGDTDWVPGLAPVAPPTSDGATITTVWEQSGVRVEERLYFVQNPATGRLDTTAIEYTLQNNNSSNRSIGLRMMLDTMIGDNDGAPYFIVGTGQVTQQFEWIGENVPDYWIAFESDTFDPDSLKGRGQLAGGTTVRPDRFVVADWPQAYSTEWDYTVNSSDAVTNDSAVILYYNPTSIGPGQSKTVRTYFGIDQSGAVAQVELTGLEVTQAIQDLNDSVVLIEDKPTYVRAHVQSTSGTVNDVTAELYGTRGGSPLPGSPLQPSNDGGHIDVWNFVLRSALDDSFYYQLPESWRNGTIELELKGVSETIDCRDHADDDDDCRAEVTFTESPAADVQFVGIIWREGSTAHDPDSTDIEAAAQQIRATFPIPRLDYHYSGDIEPTFLATQPTNPLELIRVNTMLRIQMVLDGCHIGCDRFYVGVILDPPTTGSYFAGVSLGDVSVGYLDDDLTLSHELGHSTGRDHTLCNGDEAGADDNYPYSDGHISEEDTGDNAFYGFDVFTKKTYLPSDGDLMSYCPRVWPSKWTYERIRDSLVSRYDTYTLAPELRSGDPAILISGMIEPTQGSGTLESTYIVDSPTSAPLPEPGTYVIRFENSAGYELASYSFEPDLGKISCVDCDEADYDPVGTFVLLLPWNPSTARISLLRDTQQLDTRTASNNAPTVSVTYPNGGELLSGSTAVLTWSAYDPDGDPLEYVVQYSTNAGATWLTLQSGWTSTSYELGLDALPGTDQGLLRVLASDGFHTAQDESNGLFSVATHAPHVSIQSPKDGSLFVGDQILLLEGGAYDNEDGQLGDAGLSWSSSLNGYLGGGHSLAVVASSLSEGGHTITLTAQDSDSQTGSANITVEVFRQRPVLPVTLEVYPPELGFIAAQDGGQTAGQYLSIRNGGDGTMSWTATADQSWIILSSLGGTAPTDVIVAVNPAGLPVGEYTGSIVVSASGAADSPQTIDLTLRVRSESEREYEVYLPLVMKMAGESCGITSQTVTGDSLPTANQDVYSFAGTVGTTVGVLVDTVSAASAFDIEACLSTTASSADCFIHGDDEVACTYAPPAFGCPTLNTSLPSDADGVYYLLVESGSGADYYAGAVGQYKATVTASPGICALSLVADNQPGDFR